MEAESTESLVQLVTGALAVRHQAFAEQTIARLVRRTFAAYAQARVTAYLPLLVEREVEALLRALDYDYVPGSSRTSRSA